MAEIGYATMPIIPSLKGSSSQIQSQLSGMLGRSSEAAGMKAGKQIGTGVTKGVSASTKAAGGGVFSNIGKGAEVAGVGAGRRFGTAMRESTLEYAKTIGTAMLGYMAFEKVTETLKQFAEQGERAEKTTRLTEQVIKSTGGAANVTAEDVAKLSDAIGRKAGVDDATIQSGANLMLTFRNVRNEVGKGNDMFTKAVGVSTDMAEALAAANGGTMDLRSSTLQIGKALNDPIHGMSMLQRVGVTFTDQQKAQAKQLEKSGHLMAAQKIVMGELTKEFGGAAAAMATPADKLKASWTDLEQSAGQKLLPIVDKVANVGVSGLNGLVHAVSAIPGPVRTAALAFAALKIAQGSGVSGAFRSGLIKTSGALETVRLKTMFATDAFRAETVAARAAAESQGPLAGALTRTRGVLSGVGGLSRSLKLGKVAAGVGALAVASSGVADKLGATNTATLALAGSMIGPEGTAIGAAVGGFIDLQHATKAARDAMDLTDLSVGELGKHLGEMRAQQSELTKAMAGEGSIFHQAGAAMQNAWGGNWQEKVTGLVHSIPVVGAWLSKFKFPGAKTETQLLGEAAAKAQAKINRLRGQAHLAAEAASNLGTREAKTARETLALQKSAQAVVAKFYNFDAAVKNAKGSLSGFEHQLRMQSRAALNFARNAEKVANSGVKGVGGLVKSLTQMGPDGQRIMQQLANGSKSAIRKAVGDLGNWQGAARKTARILERTLGSAVAKRYLAKLGLDTGPVNRGAKAAGRELHGVTAPKWLAHVNADIGQLLRSVNQAQNALNGMHDKWVTVHTVYDYIGKAFNGHATGGPIYGPGTSTSDSIPARLSNGEYVIRAQQAAKYRSLLDSINYGLNGYAAGGPVGGYGGLVPTKGAASAAPAVSVQSIVQLPDSLRFVLEDGMELGAYIDARNADDRLTVIPGGAK